MKRQFLKIPLLMLAILMMVGMTGCYSTPEGGQIGVVRNGGPFDNKNIRQVVPNGAGNTWVGFGSDTHWYPSDAQQRIYKIDETRDADTGPVSVPTRDGVRVKLIGTFYLNTAFNNSKEGRALLKKFDTQFGTRTFGAKGKHAWEEDGWAEFLNSVVQPVIDSNLREIMAEFDCAQLVSSCALVQRNSNGEVQAIEGDKATSNVTKIQDRINAGLTEEITAKLGEPYFKNIRFSLGPVELPGVQGAIDEAQSAFAKVSKGQAEVKQAQLESQANRERQKGYENCPACAQIDALKAIPNSITTYAPGSGFAVTGGKR